MDKMMTVTELIENMVEEFCKVYCKHANDPEYQLDDCFECPFGNLYTKVETRDGKRR